MTIDADSTTPRQTCSRRQVLGGAIAAALAGTAFPAVAGENRLAFAAADKEFTFDTGASRRVARWRAVERADSRAGWRQWRRR